MEAVVKAVLIERRLVMTAAVRVSLSETGTRLPGHAVKLRIWTCLSNK